MKDKEGYTPPLHLACENGADANVVRLLLRTFPGAIRATLQYDMTPRHFACSQQGDADAEVIKLLLAEGDSSISRLRDDSSWVHCFASSVAHLYSEYYV